MKKFYKVAAKCGHVGKRYYYLGYFYEMAESKAEAAEIVRGRGRVKHDHKDAILGVEEICLDEFLEGIDKKADEPYFSCINVQEQRRCWDQIVLNVYPEKRYADEDVFTEKRVRRPRHQEKFDWRKYDWEDVA